MAWLTPPMREALLQLAPLLPRIEDGYVWLEHPQFHPEHLTALLVLAHLIAQGAADPVERVARMLAEPDPAVRAQCLQRLGDEDPELAQELAMPLLADPDDRVRAEAAIILREPEPLCQATLSRLPADVRWRTAEVLVWVGTDEQRRRAGEALVHAPLLRHSP